MTYEIENATQAMTDCLRQAMVLHVEVIASAWDAGKLPILYWDQSDWRDSGVGTMSDPEVHVLAMSDSVTHRWVSRPPFGKVFVVALGKDGPKGSLLLNWTENGWEIEPGSTDAELSRGAN